MIRRLGIAAALALVSAGAIAQQATADVNEIAIGQSMLGYASQTSDGTVLLGQFDPDQRFVSLPEDGASEALVAFVKAAGARTVTIRYRATQGVLLSDQDIIAYPICSVATEDKTVTVAKCDEPTKAEKLSRSAQLGLALALARSSGYARGAQLSSDLLKSGGLSARERRLAFTARAVSENGLADREAEASVARDRHSVAALADYRALASLDPHNVEIQFHIAALYDELGAYAEARRSYADIVKTWPDEDFRASVRLGAIERREGNYTAALAALDDMVKRLGAQDGMKFHYHRAWTLTLLKRYDEAVKEITEGLKSQPDYSSAFLRRACANAQLGHLREAAADMTRTEQLYRNYADQADPVITADLARITPLSAALRAAVARGRRTPMPEVCQGFTDSYEKTRPRSTLL